ncbi:MAG: hypothetical protein DDT19_01866 [Syntrophomonadaceae bacterium]|nr:hypothetical protein [Bacillota bacterium]
MVSEYMIDVHENPGYQHITGKFKFLEDPVRRAERDYAQTLAKAFRETFGEGVEAGG